MRGTIKLDPPAFSEEAHGTKNPDWTKKVCQTKFDVQRLAKHIVSRTPPKSYKSKNTLYWMLMDRNHKVCKFQPFQKHLYDCVRNMLHRRDGGL